MAVSCCAGGHGRRVGTDDAQPLAVDLSGVASAGHPADWQPACTPWRRNCSALVAFLVVGLTALAPASQSTASGVTDLSATWWRQQLHEGSFFPSSSSQFAPVPVPVHVQQALDRQALRWLSASTQVDAFCAILSISISLQIAPGDPVGETVSPGLPTGDACRQRPSAQRAAAG